ncbi:MAG: hypothetical protein KDD29_01085 [Flavobacteriales bacterium]|nr:hypothetical protein [Flavobacteriales bacterium]
MKTSILLKAKNTVLLLSLILFFTQCSDDEKFEINPAFTGYISGYTSGIISNSSTIQIRLMNEVSEEVMKSSLEEDLFDFSPDIKGSKRWIDNRTIEFTPENKLKSGQLFTGTFELGEIVEVENDLEEFKFQFQTIQQAIFVQFNRMRAYDDDDLKWQMVMGKLQTADVADIEQIEKIVIATQNGKKLPLTWDHFQDGKTHEFTVDSIARGEKRSEIIISWDGEAIDADKNGEEKIQIPALDEFMVMNSTVTQQPEQYLTLHFSDPIKRNQNLEGLIYFKSNEDIRISIDRNDVHVYPSQRLSGEHTIVVEKGVKNTLDYNLMAKYEKSIMFTNIKPAVESIGDGVILPSTNGLVYPFKAVNLRAVNVKIIKVFENNITQFFQVNQYDGSREMTRVGRIIYKDEIQLVSDKPIDYGSWNTFSIDLAKLIEVEPGAIYRIQLSFDQSQSLYPCDKELELEDEYPTEDKEMARYDGPNDYYWDYYYDDEDYYYYDDYNWNEREDPCSKSYYRSSGRSITKNVFASDLGIIAKGADGQFIKAAITDIKTAEPLSGVTVEIYNYQNQLLGTQSTDGEGMVDIELKNKPFLLVAKKDKQRGYLRLDDGSSLSMSMFDIGGYELKKGVKGFIYGERGVWRPGDSLYVSFILEDKNNNIPENHPVVFELYTPESQLYQRKVKTASVNGFYDFRTATTTADPTGNWLAKVKVGGSVFTKTLKIETVKPNRLKINLDFGGDILTSSGQKGQIQAKWLHGAIARNLKTDVELSLKSGNTEFKDYKEYSFDDPSKSFYAEDKMIYQGATDAQGLLAFYPSIEVGDDAPGMLKANFKTRVFEKSGDFSIDNTTIFYSPFESYVGVKVPEGKGWSGALFSNETNMIPIATVDENGKPVSRSGVKIEIYDVRWRWWWERSDEDDLARYVANKSSNLIRTEYIDTKNGKGMFEMKFDQNMYGRKLIRVIDPVSGHSSGQLFYLTYKGWWNNGGQDNPEGAEMLTFSTDKKSYNVGEEVKVEMPQFKEGRALVSIESGSKVVESFWVKPNEINSSFTFKTTPEMAPNVFVHISLIQPHVRVQNDLPIRMYGVQGIGVEDPNTHLEPVIKMPDELAPEKEVVINVKEAKGKKMTYTVAVVDEGLLDLTRFKTPDPWSHFYAKEALGVKTWDMYKYVLGAYSGEMAGLLALGGDESANPNDASKVNRFKPVVKFMGPFTVEKGGSNTHKFVMPNYVGSVRTMVVAGYEGAYGSSEKTTPVKKPLMVLATMPRVVGPTELVKLPVTVFAMDKSVKNVSIQVQTNNLFSIEGEQNKTITFSEEGDQVVNFDLRVAEKIGTGKVKVTVKSGNKTATHEIELAVRVPNPRINEYIEAVVEPGETWTGEYSPVGMAGTNNGVIEVSTIPPLNLESRLQYLIQYPHGCIEQTTSSVFPQLYLADILDLSTEQKAKIQSNITEGINRLKTFQLSSGGMTYWPGAYSEASEWGTNYAGHFMIAAKEKGYALPDGFLNNWVKFQKQMANSWSAQPKGNYSYYNGELIQAYRLYTLALAKKPAMGAMNRMKETANLSVAAKWRLAGAYMLAGKENVAKALVKNIETTVENYKELSYTYGSSVRDEAMILEVLTLLKDKSRAKKVFDGIAKNLASRSWYGTQTTAYSLMAIAKFIGGSGKSNMQYQLALNGKSDNVNSSTPIQQNKIDFKTNKGGTVSITNKGDRKLFVQIQLDGIPLTGDQNSSQNDLNMEVKYLSMDGKTIDPTVLEQGTDFIAEVTIGNPGVRGHYKEMALTQIFPSGWEIRNTRMDVNGSTQLKDKPDYEDFRDDRVYTYFDVAKNKSRTYRVILNASYLGEFYLPTVYCEAMYDHEINAKKAGKWVKVVQAGGE